MAIITPSSPTNAGGVITPAATQSTGDEVVAAGRGVYVNFRNGHTAAITVSCAPLITSTLTSNAGIVQVPTRTVSVPPNGGEAEFEFRQDDWAAYLNASGRIPFTYTGHNPALLINAASV